MIEEENLDVKTTENLRVLVVKGSFHLYSISVKVPSLKWKVGKCACIGQVISKSLTKR